MTIIFDQMNTNQLISSRL